MEWVPRSMWLTFVQVNSSAETVTRDLNVKWATPLPAPTTTAAPTTVAPTTTVAPPTTTARPAVALADVRHASDSAPVAPLAVAGLGLAALLSGGTWHLLRRRRAE
jgi:hypothetical protein